MKKRKSELPTKLVVPATNKEAIAFFSHLDKTKHEFNIKAEEKLNRMIAEMMNSKK